jgi:two-component system response regulator YesN
MIIKESLANTEFNSIISDIWGNPDNIHSCYIAVNVIKTRDSRTIVVFSSIDNGYNDRNDFEECIDRAVAHLMNEIKQRVYISISAGIGTTVCDLVDLHESYNISCLAIAQKFFHGKGHILKYTERKFSDIYNLKINDINDINDELIKSIMNFDLNKVNLHIESLFSIIVAQNISRDYILNICMELINRLTIVLNDFNITLNDVFGNNIVLWQQLLKYETLNDIQEWIKYMYASVILYVKNNTLKQSDRAIEKVLQYIEKNYMKEISLKDISDELHYSTNYLGKLFKKQLKKGFREYLTEYRIRKAAELLRQNRYKIYEVAEMVGYKNVPSFIKQFKNIFMVTPAEYSERCKLT